MQLLIVCIYHLQKDEEVLCCEENNTHDNIDWLHRNNDYQRQLAGMPSEGQESLVADTQTTEIAIQLPGNYNIYISQGPTIFTIK